MWLCSTKILFAKTDSRPDLAYGHNLPTPVLEDCSYIWTWPLNLIPYYIIAWVSLDSVYLWHFLTHLLPSPSTMIYLPIWTLIFLDFQTSWPLVYLYSYYLSDHALYFFTYLFWSPSPRAMITRHTHTHIYIFFNLDEVIANNANLKRIPIPT